MNKPFIPETLAESQTQVTTLRATLRAHYPQKIDLEQGWAQISAHLNLGPEQNGAVPTRFPHQSPKKHRFIKPWQVAVAAILLLSFVGVGLAVPSSGWLSNAGHNQSLAYAYANVNQVREDQGITFDVTKAYANQNSTSILLNATLSSELSQKYIAAYAADSTLTYQNQTAESHIRANDILFGMQHIGKANAVMVFRNVEPSAGTPQITLTWQVTRVVLLDRQGNPTYVSGNWAFTFTIPFHHDNSGPPPSTLK